MAAATASQPEINITMVIVRLISASSLPCCGHTLFANDSLVAAVFQAIDQRSAVTNQFALSNAHHLPVKAIPLPRRRPMIDGQAGSANAWRLNKRVMMVRVFSRIRSLVLVVGCVAGLAGCAGSVAPEIKRLPERVELSGTFYRGVANQSGPQVLASMLSQQGIVITPGLLEKPLHLPGAEAQLQQNMQNLAREYGMVVYPLDSNLPALLTQVAAGYPVMVRFTEGSAFWAEPRYAILAGYNRQKQTVLLRVGHESSGVDGLRFV